MVDKEKRQADIAKRQKAKLDKIAENKKREKELLDRIKKATKFEYIVNLVAVKSSWKSSAGRNTMGAAGWELVSVFQIAGEAHEYYKRPL